MKAIIIDDESNVIEGLSVLIENYCPEIEVIGSAFSIVQGYDLIQGLTPDLLFLDLELSDGNGLELLDKIQDRDFEVIFVTAYDQYAIEAFKYSSIDYLLKPIDPDDLVSAADRAKTAHTNSLLKLRMKTLLNNLNSQSLKDKKLIVADKEYVHALPINEILYLKADGAYTLFKLENQEVLSSRNLKTYEEILKESGFFRTHHSYLVNLSHMYRFDRHNNILRLKNDVNIPVSSRKKELLLEKIKDFTLL